MSIVALEKVTLVGHQNNKEEVLSGLQALGCLHLIPLTPEGEARVLDFGPVRASSHSRYRSQQGRSGGYL